MKISGVEEKKKKKKTCFIIWKRLFILLLFYNYSFASAVQRQIPKLSQVFSNNNNNNNNNWKAQVRAPIIFFKSLKMEKNWEKSAKVFDDRLEFGNELF